MIKQERRENKAGDTLSSRHVSSPHEMYATTEMWEECCHVISRTSTPITFLLSHTFREAWRRDLRVECSSDVISQLFAEKHTVYVGGYTETDTTGTLSPATACRQKLTR